MKILGRRPKLTEAQQRELEAWARIGTSKVAAARYFGIGATALDAYLKKLHKFPVRDERNCAAGSEA